MAALDTAAMCLALPFLQILALEEQLLAGKVVQSVTCEHLQRVPKL